LFLLALEAAAANAIKPVVQFVFFEGHIMMIQQLRYSAPLKLELVGINDGVVVVVVLRGRIRMSSQMPEVNVQTLINIRVFPIYR
jgi:hypothetical protein